MPEGYAPCGSPLAGIFEPPYFLAAGLSWKNKKADWVRTLVQFAVAAAHLTLWLVVFFRELHFLNDDGSKYKEVANDAGVVLYNANVNQLQSLTFTTSTTAFCLVLGAFALHLVLKGNGFHGYSDASAPEHKPGDVLPSGVTGVINGLLCGSILTNALLFIYIFVDVDRMLYYNKNGAAGPTYAGPEYSHDDKQQVAAIVGYKILLLAILKANQDFQEAHLEVKKEKVSDEKALLGRSVLGA